MKKTIITMAAMLLAISACAQNSQQETFNPYPSGQLQMVYTAPKTPSSVEFAGTTVKLDNSDLRERMDREMLAFTYAHQNTILMIKRSKRIFPQIEPILKECGIPDDLKYLMAIESNLSPTAVSTAGAAGLWQFMAATGRQFGLEVNENIDERYHIEKATRAACKYLSDAYKKYGDWMTVAASYNAGQGRISSELAKQQVDSAMDLWLVEETSRYMFRILTAKLFLENPATYGFQLEEDDYYQYEEPEKVIKVTTTIPDLAAFAKKNGTTYRQIRLANPWLRQTSLQDKSGKVYEVVIPKN